MKIPCLLLLVLAPLACKQAQQVPAGPQLVGRNDQNSQALNQVVVLDKDLVDTRKGRDPLLVCDRHGGSRTPTGTIRAWAVLGSLSQQELALEVRMTFYAEDGRPVEQGASSWRKVWLSPMESETVESSSLSTQAGAYYIEIRRAR